MTTTEFGHLHRLNDGVRIAEERLREARQARDAELVHLVDSGKDPRLVSMEAGMSISRLYQLLKAAR